MGSPKLAAYKRREQQQEEGVRVEAHIPQPNDKKESKTQGSGAGYQRKSKED